MKLKFVHDFAFYVGNKPILTFDKNEEINVLHSTDEDPHSYKGTVMKMSDGQNYTHEGKHYWVEAKNGTTVWTSIHALLLQGILIPEE